MASIFAPDWGISWERVKFWSIVGVVIGVVWLIVELGARLMGKGFRRTAARRREEERLERAEREAKKLAMASPGESKTYQGQMSGFRVRLDLENADLTLRWRDAVDKRFLFSTQALQTLPDGLSGDPIVQQMDNLSTVCPAEGTDTEALRRIDSIMDNFSEKNADVVEDVTIDERGVIFFLVSDFPEEDGRLTEFLESAVQFVDELEGQI
jgi:hypothetical protein